MKIDNHLQIAAKALAETRLDDADRLFRRILRANPELFDALHALGIIAYEQGNPQRALNFYERACRQNPTVSQLFNNRANALTALGRTADALDARNAALALNPTDAILHLSRGNTLMLLNRHAEARNDFTRALALDPTLLLAWQNKAATETRLGLYDAALATCDQLIARQPAPEANGEPARAFVMAHWNAAAICLAHGDYARGWREYEWRWLDPAFRAEHATIALKPWRGEPIDGKTILLHAEQGFGDTLQFCRYVPMVRARGARVILQAPAPLLPLLQTLAGADQLVAMDDRPPSFDAHCPLISLPLAFGTLVETIPAETPYLAADPDRIAAWQSILGPRTRPRIGLAWSGSEPVSTEISRSAPLGALAPLIRPGFDYVAVQKDIRPDDAETARALGIGIVSDRLRDFADTAALMALLDLTISIDTAAAHLAGALNRPVWLLLHHTAEWRWLRNRDDSPWYPTARLFRQRAPLQWGELAEQVAGALETFARA